MINNASELGGSPQPALRDLDRPRSNGSGGQPGRAAGADPGRIAQLSPTRSIINISSDAAADHYEGWGGYAASKAALDHLTLTWAAEEPDRRWYAVDPGDLRTAMHQAAFPGEDISDRPLPETVTPAFLQLIGGRPGSGRYKPLPSWSGALPMSALREHRTPPSRSPTTGPRRSRRSCGA